MWYAKLKDNPPEGWGQVSFDSRASESESSFDSRASESESSSVALSSLLSPPSLMNDMDHWDSHRNFGNGRTHPKNRCIGPFRSIRNATKGCVSNARDTQSYHKHGHKRMESTDLESWAEEDGSVSAFFEERKTTGKKCVLSLPHVPLPSRGCVRSFKKKLCPVEERNVVTYVAWTQSSGIINGFSHVSSDL